MKSRAKKSLGTAIRDSIQEQSQESAITIARAVEDWIENNGVFDVKLGPSGIDVWVNGNFAKEFKWANLLEEGLASSKECGCHKESPKEWIDLSKKLKQAARFIDEAAG